MTQRLEERKPGNRQQQGGKDDQPSGCGDDDLVLFHRGKDLGRALRIQQVGRREQGNDHDQKEL